MHWCVYFRSALRFVCGIFVFVVTWILLGRSSESNISSTTWKQFMVGHFGVSSLPYSNMNFKTLCWQCQGGCHVIGQNLSAERWTDLAEICQYQGRKFRGIVFFGNCQRKQEYIDAWEHNIFEFVKCYWRKSLENVANGGWKKSEEKNIVTRRERHQVRQKVWPKIWRRNIYPLVYKIIGNGGNEYLWFTLWRLWQYAKIPTGMGFDITDTNN